MLRHGMNVHETTINRKTQKNIISNTESAYGNTSFQRRKMSTQFGDLAVYYSHTRQTEEYSIIRPIIKSSPILLGFNQKWISYLYTVGFFYSKMHFKN